MYMSAKKYRKRAIETDLFDASNSFLNNPCLFPKILKSSDELNLLKYKKILAEIVI